MLTVVQAMPADTVGREGSSVVDEDEVEPVADDEAVVRADSSLCVAFESLCVGSGGSSQRQEQR